MLKNKNTFYNLKKNSKMKLNKNIFPAGLY